MDKIEIIKQLKHNSPESKDLVKLLESLEHRRNYLKGRKLTEEVEYKLEENLITIIRVQELIINKNKI